MKLPLSVLFFFIIPVFLLGACTAKKKSEQPGFPKEVLTELKLTSFQGLPADMAGCSCYFSESAVNFEKEIYLFASNYEELCVISVENKIVRLDRVSSTRQPHTFGDHDYEEIYANKAYKAVIEVKYKKPTGEETWWNAGTLTLTTPDGRSTTKQLVGECGC